MSTSRHSCVTGLAARPAPGEPGKAEPRVLGEYTANVSHDADAAGHYLRRAGWMEGPSPQQAWDRHRKRENRRRKRGAR